MDKIRHLIMNGTLPCRLFFLVFLFRTLILSGHDAAVRYHLVGMDEDSITDSTCYHPGGKAGQRLGEPFTIKVVDDKGHPVSGFPVYFIILSSPDGSSDAFFEADTVFTDQDGRAATYLHLGNKAGDYLCAAKIESFSEPDSLIFKATARKKFWIILMTAGLLGGLAFFLLGIHMLSEGLQKSAGEKMRRVFERLTDNRLKAFLAGIFMTVMVQSSSATTVMLVSFVNSRLMRFSQTIGIILGASVGATITAQIIAFRLSDYALLIVGVSFLFYTACRKQKYRNIGYAMMGFGILFFGMHIMAQAMEPLQSMKGIISLFTTLERPVAGILAGTLLTAVLQSSSAFVGILIILGSQHLLTLSAAVPMLIGASLGTCITAVIASLGSSRESKQVAWAHTLFKATGVLIMVWFIPELVRLVEGISAHDTQRVASGSFSSAIIARQIANAYTIYNLIIALLFLPFTRTFAKLVARLLPAREEKAEVLKTWYLDANLLNTPPLALAVAKQEILRMIQVTHRMAEEIIIPFIDRKTEIIEKIVEREEEINFLRDTINAYLVQVSRKDISAGLVEETYLMMYAVNEFEQIGDIISSTLGEKARWWCRSDFTFSAAGKEEIQHFHLQTLKLLYYSFGMFREFDRDKAVMMKSKYKEFRNLYIDFEKQHYQRLKQEVEESIDSSKTHLEIITSFKNIGSHATNIARVMLKK
jgi:phosphate:Na+ symporter